jgi:hypothetical protein
LRRFFCFDLVLVLILGLAGWLAIPSAVLISSSSAVVVAAAGFWGSTWSPGVAFFSAVCCGGSVGWAG